MFIQETGKVPVLPIGLETGWSKRALSPCAEAVELYGLCGGDA
jgi:hypothetical protein